MYIYIYIYRYIINIRYILSKTVIHIYTYRQMFDCFSASMYMCDVRVEPVLLFVLVPASMDLQLGSRQWSCATLMAAGKYLEGQTPPGKPVPAPVVTELQ